MRRFFETEMIEKCDVKELKEFNKSKNVFIINRDTKWIPNIEDYDYVVYASNKREYLYVAESLKDDATKLMFLLTHQLYCGVIEQIMSTIDFGNFETYKPFYDNGLEGHLTKQNFFHHGLMSVIGTAKKFLIK